jgi:hypothetical protein
VHPSLALTSSRNFIPIIKLQIKPRLLPDIAPFISANWYKTQKSVAGSGGGKEGLAEFFGEKIFGEGGHGATGIVEHGLHFGLEGLVRADSPLRQNLRAGQFQRSDGLRMGLGLASDRWVGSDFLTLRVRPEEESGQEQNGGDAGGPAQE